MKNSRTTRYSTTVQTNQTN